MAAGQHRRVIIDPSVLFTDAAIGWLRDDSLRPYLAVSLALRQFLTDPQLFGRLTEFEGIHDVERRLQVVDLLRGIETFSWESVDLPSAPSAIRDSLHDSDDPLADIFADEWVFLVSQSWGVLAGSARTLKAFGHASARVYDVVDERMKAALQAVREQLPPPILNGMKVLKREVAPSGRNFVIVAGGFAAGVIFPFVALPAGALGVLLAGEAVIAGDP